MPKIPELYPYQKIGIFRATRKFKGRVLFADDVGLGKSAQALHTALYFKLRTEGAENRPIIIVCPNSVKYGWEIEIHKHTNKQCWILNGLNPPTRMPLHVPSMIIINWDILRGGWTDRLIALNPLAIIGDESQFSKNHRSQRTKAFRRLCKNVPHVILLSGTPIENGPIEFYNALNILRKDLFSSFRTFAFRYSKPKMTPWGIKYEGAANCEELHKLLISSCMLRRTKQEVLKDLPPLTRTVVPLDIDEKEYKEANENFLGWLFKNNPGKALKVKNAVQLAKLTYLFGLIAKLKIPGITEWINDFLEGSEKKLVVFGHHREFLETLHETFKNQSVLVYGGITGKKRQGLINKFVSDKNTRIFFGSIGATGTGINKLQTVCCDMVMGELIWVGVKLLQVEGRLHRLGQKDPVSIYYLIAKDTLESLLCKIIHKKQARINALVDGEPNKQEFDILKEMFQQLHKERKNK